MNKKLSTLVIGGAVLALGAGSVALPSAYAANDGANTTINATIGSVISISTSGEVDLSITPTSSGSASSASDTVSVSTNNSTGYNLQLSASTSDTNLSVGANTIGASANSFADPDTLEVNAWGYRVDSQGSFGSGTTSAQTNAADLTGSWAGVPASSTPDTIKNVGTVASDDETTVWYGAKVDSTKPNGTYQGTVTYTASTN